MYWLVIISAFLLCAAIGVLSGMALERRTWRVAEQRRADAKEIERQRRIHDTHRVSVARPDTIPGRVSKATIDMGASHMGQSERET